ncbi:succinate dehydrogenase assembly factor 2 [Pararhodobacter sp. SW119]|uniref:FAD assembly factor SdhE n=1 Tax=Pararhodobacter sp. SW119 TaxID=2780075 RepID=UPI001AE0850D|nr:succinate dehydrogenase assembly factor 2 [Pararhodobacter sp. SW119]
MNEGHDAELRRLRMRAWRRGTREMDLILGPFADSALAALSDAERENFDRLLSENDHDLYQWLTARITPAGEAASGQGPDHYAALLDQIAAFAVDRLRATGT